MRAIAFGCAALAACTACLMPASAEKSDQPSAQKSARAIFRCDIDGVLTFSDRPCDASASIYELDAGALNTFEPPAAQQVRQHPAPARKPTQKGGRAAVAADNHKQTCERLAQGLKDVRAKQRSGYKAGEGERLKARETKLKSQLRTARCG